MATNAMKRQTTVRDVIGRDAGRRLVPAQPVARCVRRQAEPALGSPAVSTALTLTAASPIVAVMDSDAGSCSAQQIPPALHPRIGTHP